MPSTPDASGQGYLGQQTAFSDLDPFNGHAFLFRQLLGKASFCTLVQVVSVSNAGGVSGAGTVDVLPLVNQVDGRGNAVPHQTVHGLPYQRLLGGTNAVILDPQVGDIGVCVFADRDISAVKATGKQSNPGSGRRNSYSDGVYLGGVLNGAPAQYIQFQTSGITILSPTQITLQAPQIALNGAITQTAGTAGGAVSMVGPLHVTNDVTAEGTSLHTHVHGGVQTGGGNTGVPI